MTSPLRKSTRRLVSVNDIFVDDKFNCRGFFTLESVRELSELIENAGGYPNGLLFEPVVRPYRRVPGKKYHLVAGHRRFKACTVFLKWPRIPVCIRDLDDDEAADLNYLENLAREDLNILQEAWGIVNSPRYQGKGCREVANKIGKPERWVLQRRKLLTLPDEVQQKAAAGFLSGMAIESIARLETPEEQIEAARLYEKAREKRKNASLESIPEKYKTKFRGRATKQTLRAMTAQLFERGITSGLPTRLLAWAAGRIKAEELESDIQEYLEMLQRLKDVREAEDP